MESDDEDLKKAIALSLEDGNSFELGSVISHQSKSHRPLLRDEEDDERLNAAIALSLMEDFKGVDSGSKSKRLVIDITSDNGGDDNLVCTFWDIYIGSPAPETWDLHHSSDMHPECATYQHKPQDPSAFQEK